MMLSPEESESGHLEEDDVTTESSTAPELQRTIDREDTEPTIKRRKVDSSDVRGKALGTDGHHKSTFLDLGGSRSQLGASNGGTTDSEEGLDDSAIRASKSRFTSPQDIQTGSKALSRRPAKWNSGARATIRTTLGEVHPPKMTVQRNRSIEDLSTDPENSSSSENASRSSRDADVPLPLQEPPTSGSPNVVKNGPDRSSRISTPPNGSTLQQTMDSEDPSSEEEGELHESAYRSNVSSPASSPQKTTRYQAGIAEDFDGPSMSFEAQHNETNVFSSGQGAKEVTPPSDKILSTLTLGAMPPLKRELQRRYFNLTDSSGDYSNDNTVAVCLVCRKEGHDGDDCPSLAVSSSKLPTRFPSPF
jgi:hypothetical protein